MKNNKHFEATLIILASIIPIMLIFSLSYNFDNKYTRNGPRGENGTITLSQRDLDSPVFLIDGWMLSVDDNDFEETFIGQYSDFSYAPGGTSPFGKGVYKLNINLTDGPEVITMELPEIFSEYTLEINDNVVAYNGSGTMVSFLADEDTRLKFTTYNDTHYYSGLFYPPVIGTTHVIERICNIRMIIYIVLSIFALMMGIFSIIFWLWEEKEIMFYHFAYLSFAIFLNCCHPLAWKLGIASCIWYCIEDMSRLLIWLEAISITSIVAGLWENKKIRVTLSWATFLIVLLTGLSVAFIIPNNPGFIPVYGYTVEIIALLSWAVLSVATGIGFGKNQNIFSVLTLIGCCVLGASIFDKLLYNNLFEPIYALWQDEWASLILMIIFSILIVSYNGKMFRENKEMKQGLEELVEKKTAQLESVIEERKNFFSDMAHNLKAPIATIHGLISVIQQENVGIDDELLGYIAIIENENLIMQERVQSLNTLNDFDRIKDKKEYIDINDLLEEVEYSNKPDADVLGINLFVGRLNTTAEIFAQKEKLLIMFENLIYNSFSFTPQNGAITIQVSVSDKNAVFVVKDTGSGVPKDKLPYIFDRFYVGRDIKSEGSGLGLYIVKLTCEELGGSISVNSELNVGTAFTISLPLAERNL